MQVDMHYYGTYAMARAAGLKPDACRTIATAAQFVDDNADGAAEHFRDGAQITVLATAHHSADIANIERDDQRLVWVPFHFLPGNEGDSYSERLICRKDSLIAQQMIDHHLAQADRTFAQELMGVAAHVYADTFSHYGFSGISSASNKVRNGSIDLHGLDPEVKSRLCAQAAGFFGKHPAMVTDFFGVALEGVELASGALGHGSVATYPDRPYLSWEFTYETSGQTSRRENHTDFLEACGKLHEMFRRFAERRPDLAAGSGKDFPQIADTVAKILSKPVGSEDRSALWQAAARSGALFQDTGEEIPPYDAQSLHLQRENLKTLEDSRNAVDLPVYRFYQATANHRTFVLRDLLPSHGIVID